MTGIDETFDGLFPKTGSPLLLNIGGPVALNSRLAHVRLVKLLQR